MSKTATKPRKPRKATKAGKLNGKPQWFTETLDDSPLAKCYITLSVPYVFVDVPYHPLVIPMGWARRVNCDFQFSECDLCSREMAIGRAARENIAAMEANEEAINSRAIGENQVEFLWALVFKIGAIEDTSCIMVEHGCAAKLFIDTTVTLVEPTREEVERHWEFGDESPVVALAEKVGAP